jgi:chemotaxis signal transduction protein
VDASLVDPAVRLAAAGIGAVRLGIPLAAVVQAIPVPDVPALLPRRQGALRGVVLHEGVPVPVVDLARWVDVGSAPAAPPGSARILILHDGGRTLALQVDSVDGLVDVACGGLVRLHHDDSGEEVFHSVARVADGDGILSVLDVGRLATLAASWHQGDAQSAPPQAAVAQLTQAMHDYALLQLDGLRLGVCAGDLVEVAAMPALARFGGAIAGAWCDWRGRQLPVLAPGALPGLPAAEAAPLLAVVEHGGLALGLPVLAALALERFAAPGDAGFEAGAPTATAYDAGGNAIRLLDTAALFARFPEALLSKPEPVNGATSRGLQDGGRPNDDAYIVFEAGQLAATPIAAVEHILPLAPEWSPDAPGATMPWKGAAIPLVDLRPNAPADAPGHVLVASSGGKAAGYVVTRVELLVPAGSARLYRLGATPGRSVAFITVDAAEGQASYRIVDLAQGWRRASAGLACNGRALLAREHPGCPEGRPRAVEEGVVAVAAADARPEQRRADPGHGEYRA